MMLLRFSKHIRNYDWFAVVVEILVLIVGVFLGFQVTEWNQERILSSQQQMYVERIKSDLLDDIRESDTVIRVNSLAMENIRYLENVIRNPSHAGLDPNKIFQALGRPGGVRQVQLRRETFEELRNNGRLNVLENRELETALVEYYSNRDVRDQFNFFGIESSLAYGEAADGLLTIDQKLATYPFRDGLDIDLPDLDISESEAIQLAESMASNKSFSNILPRLYMDKLGAMREAIFTKRICERIIALIEQEEGYMEASSTNET